MEKISVLRYVIRNKITKDYYRGTIDTSLSSNVFSPNIDDAILYIGKEGLSMAYFDLGKLVNHDDMEILECEIIYLLKNVKDA